MKDLLNQITQGLESNLYYLSFFVALSIPDICGALESKNGEASKEKFADWFNKHIAQKYNGNLCGEDCYYFRCSLLHQGSSQHSKNKYSRILFIEPSAATVILHNNVMDDVLNIDINIFCQDIVNGASKWLQDFENTELYKTNYDKFIRRYPDGLKPYIVGIPVIS